VGGSFTLIARSLVLRLMPGSATRRLKSWQLSRRRRVVRAGPVLDREAMRQLLRERLGIMKGRVVFVHHSLDLLHLDFPAAGLMDLLREAVGPEGTLAFPSFPAIPSFEFLKSGAVFDSRRIPGYTGLLGEMARRIPGARRSVHPIRSVVAVGPAAEFLTEAHHRSTLPCDRNSPFHRLHELGGLIVGLGVSSRNLTFVHVLDDLMPERLPFDVYRPERFSTPCLDAAGTPCTVTSRAHDPMRMLIDVAAFLERHVDHGVAEDFAIGPMRFFRAEASPLLGRLITLAGEGTTIYRDSSAR
jgi:aminoglycoside N3'-acetyltransferase